jgi:hypothetical protein
MNWGVLVTKGGSDAIAWLSARQLHSDRPWYVEVALDVVDRPAELTYSSEHDTRFHLNLYPEEWGVFACHRGRSSWIRFTDEPFIHGRDDYHLVDRVHELGSVGVVMRDVERMFEVEFRRNHALIRTNVGDAEPVIRQWLASW